MTQQRAYVHEVAQAESGSVEARVLQCAERVWAALGSGHNEHAYQCALEHELRASGFSVEATPPISITYRGASVAFAQPDIILREHKLVVELKAVAGELGAERGEGRAQLASYMRLLEFDRGLLINFTKRAQQYEEVPLQCVLFESATRPQVRPSKRALNKELTL